VVLKETGKEAVRTYLIDRNLITVKEIIQTFASLESKGFHDVYRFSTNKSNLILKQIKKTTSLDQLPFDSNGQEARFYDLIKSYDYLARFMPEFYLLDEDNEWIVLEEVPDAANFHSLYKTHHINVEEVQQLVKWLNHLHRVRLQPKEKAGFEQPVIKEFYSQAFFDFIPTLLHKQGSPFFPELQKINDSTEIQSSIAGLKNLYKQGGFTLLHGDYSPGNWLLSDGSVYIIDPKFSTFGKPEMDVGTLIAHLLLASIPREKIDSVFNLYEDDTVDRQLTFRFAGLEMMRRITGAYPAALPGTITQKKNKLNDAVQLIMG
jgi:5-methylthioribose kinase